MLEHNTITRKMSITESSLPHKLDNLVNSTTSDNAKIVKNVFASQNSPAEQQVIQNVRNDNTHRSSSTQTSSSVLPDNNVQHDRSINENMCSNYRKSSPDKHDPASASSANLVYDQKKYSSNGIVVLRTLMTTIDAGVVIGLKGKVISEIRNITGCRAEVSGQSNYSYERIMTVSGTPDNLATAYYLIANRLAESTAGGRSASSQSNQDKVVVIRLLVIHPLVGSIIGKEGSRIQEIQKKSDVKIAVSKTPLADSVERVVELTGIPSNIETSIFIISKCLAENRILIPQAPLYTPELSLSKPYLKIPSSKRTNARLPQGKEWQRDQNEQPQAVNKPTSATNVSYIKQTPKPNYQQSLETSPVKNTYQKKHKVVPKNYTETNNLNTHQPDNVINVKEFHDNNKTEINGIRSSPAHPNHDQRCYYKYNGISTVADGSEKYENAQYDEILTFPQAFEKVYGFLPPIGFSSNQKNSGDADEQNYETTYVVSIPANTVGCILGRSGSIIGRIRRMSGAKVIIKDFVEDCPDRVIVITGTDTELKKALFMLYIQLEVGKHE